MNRLWRIVASGFSFTCFGVGGLVLWLIGFPMLNLAVRDRARRARLARAIVRRSFVLFIALIRGLGVLRHDIDGEERLDRQGLLVLANHPTLLDVVFLIALIPDANCVVSARRARNPFMRGPIRACGYLCNDSGAGLIADCIASLQQGSNLLIFPEGTRTPLTGIVRLRRGAANIAVRGRRDITPVLIDCHPRSLTKGLPWWRVPPAQMRYCIQVGEDVPVRDFIDRAGGEPALAARRLSDYLQHYFQTEKPAHASA